jgi:CheY-like chemotaxis protein
MNLLGNAVKFTREGKIQLSARKIKKERRDFLEVQISDTGIGIPISQRRKLFKRFSQLHGSEEYKLEGSGLGLAICKAICEAGGGEIRYEAQSDKGSIFTFNLPLIEVVPLKAMNKMNCQDFDHKSVPDFSGMIDLLVVEDNLTNGKLLIKRLEKWGIHPDWAKDGLEAFESCKNKHYDLVLMDCQMPVMSGFEATEKIKSELSNSPQIVALTANAYAEDKKRCLDSGMDGYISKPVKKEQLLQVLLDACQSKNSAA